MGHAGIVVVDAGSSCECHQSQTSVCQVLNTTCSTDTQCPAYFKCVIPPAPTCAPNPSPNSGISACEQMAMDAHDIVAAPSGTCQPMYKGGSVELGSSGSTTTTTAPEASDPAAGGRGSSTLPPSSHSGDAGADDDGASVPVDQPHCSVGAVGAGHAQTTGFVMFGVLMFALRLRRQRKRG